jgi:2-polyprenyl-6-methoxyphenol hydroxylase-like FAD-dependent oxidoreductase
MDTDVLIVGAGPTGLMLACWLEHLGIRPLVIDKKQALTETQSRALIVQARTLETYDMLGIVERALQQGIPETMIRLLVNQRRAATIKTKDAGQGLSPYPYLFIMGQDRTEQLLLQHFTELGGQVRWETTLGELSPDDEGVRAELRHADGHSEMVRARYVCGCDGASSQVRHSLGIEFPGGTYTQRFFLADVQGPARENEGEINICVDEKFFHAIVPMPGLNRYRIIGYIAPSLLDKPDLTYEDVRPYVESSSGLHVTETFWFSTYDSHHRMAGAFRWGRIFLLGDAAHIHSPIGGQGMNTGLMDATNLGWKLAAVIRGQANERLLDSYEPERMAFARLLIKTTDRLFSLVTSPSAGSDLFRSIVMSPLSSLVFQLPQVRRLFFALISQTRINYRESPISRGAAGRVHAGDRLPWVQWREGGSNYDALRTLKPHLQVYGAVSSEVEAFAREYPQFSLTHFPFTAEAARAGLQDGACYLLRPDGYVAYATSRFSQEDLLTFLRNVWGWQEAGANVEKQAPY